MNSGIQSLSADTMTQPWIQQFSVKPYKVVNIPVKMKVRTPILPPGK